MSKRIKAVPDRKRPNPFGVPAKALPRGCENCAHAGASHSVLTRDGLTKCKECPGGSGQCHKMRRAVAQTQGRLVTARPTAQRRPVGTPSVRMRIWIDGACNPNPGPAAWGLHAVADDGRVIDAGGYIGEGTNNIAEHEALRAALTLAEEDGATDVQVIADSQLVVRQARGEYAVNDPKLRAILTVSLVISEGFESFRIWHVAREKNTAADALSKEALTKRAGFRREFTVAAPISHVFA